MSSVIRALLGALLAVVVLANVSAVVSSCATVKQAAATAINVVADCAKPAVVSTVQNILPIVALVLNAAVEDEWEGLLDKLATMWEADGPGFVACAVREMQGRIQNASAGVAAASSAPRAMARAKSYLAKHLPK